jgi:hypothetical protein
MRSRISVVFISDELGLVSGLVVFIAIVKII